MSAASASTLRPRRPRRAEALRRRARPRRASSSTAYRGEVLALLGDNGAGKSTLIKCISGVHRLDEGEILLDGEPVAHPSVRPRRARAGIETVYQDLALFDNLTPAQNFYCGREIAFPAWLPRGRALPQAPAPWTGRRRPCIDRLKVNLPRFDAPVGADVGRPAPGHRGGARHRVRPQGRRCWTNRPRRSACARRARCST